MQDADAFLNWFMNVLVEDAFRDLLKKSLIRDKFTVANPADAVEVDPSAAS